MNDQQKRKLISRLHRLEGQVRAVEKYLDNPDPLFTVNQLEAVIAAGQSSLVEYLEIVMNEPTISPELRQKLIKRLVRH